MSWRIKTEQEFIKTFGPNWGQIVVYGWDPGMDNLFGRFLSEEQAIEMLTQNPMSDNPFLLEEWSISKDMCVIASHINVYSRLLQLVSLL